MYCDCDCDTKLKPESGAQRRPEHAVVLEAGEVLPHLNVGHLVDAAALALSVDERRGEVRHPPLAQGGDETTPAMRKGMLVHNQNANGHFDGRCDRRVDGRGGDGTAVRPTRTALAKQGRIPHEARMLRTILFSWSVGGKVGRDVCSAAPLPQGRL